MALAKLFKHFWAKAQYLLGTISHGLTPIIIGAWAIENQMLIKT
jgi:hypothetical protein